MTIKSVLYIWTNFHLTPFFFLFSKLYSPLIKLNKIQYLHYETDKSVMYLYPPITDYGLMMGRGYYACVCVWVLSSVEYIVFKWKKKKNYNLDRLKLAPFCPIRAMIHMIVSCLSMKTLMKTLYSPSNLLWLTYMQARIRNKTAIWISMNVWLYVQVYEYVVALHLLFWNSYCLPYGGVNNYAH